jgi:prepilin-type N-terminal cleavage/methylation domain-containing protein
MDDTPKAKTSLHSDLRFTSLPASVPSRKKLLGFTLVELVVVIAILAILGTIGFLSIQGYSASARDGSRISNLSNLQKGLTLWKVVAGTFPMPENAVTLTASGVAIGYQGFARDQVAGLAKLSPGSTRDPLDAGMHTTYAVNAGQTKMQAMAFLEDGSKASGIGMVPGVGEAWAGGSSYSSRVPVSKGDALGIVLSNTGGNVNQPVQERYDALSFTGLDLARTTSGSGYAMVFSAGDSTVPASGTGAYTGSLFTFAYHKREELIGNKALAASDSSLVGYWDMETVCAAGSC